MLMKFLFTYQYGKITQYEFSAFDWSVGCVDFERLKFFTDLKNMFHLLFVSIF